MKRKKNKNTVGYGKLEDRRLLAVGVSSSDGNLLVHGDADGLVEITATGEATYTVSDNGFELGTYSGVEGDIRVHLDQSGSSDDMVKIEFGTQHVDNLFVNLGNGDNDFEANGLTSTTPGIVDRIYFKGGSGNDEFRMDLHSKVVVTGDMGFGNDTMIVDGKGSNIRFLGGQGTDHFKLVDGEHYFENFGSSAIVAGPGDDVIDIEGSVWNPNVWAGSGNDTVNFSGVTSEAFFHLGSGDNTFNNSGWAASNLTVFAGGGNDTMNLGEAYVGNYATIMLGHGNNTFNVDTGLTTGDSTRILLRGEDGNDSVNISSTVELRGHVRSVLGDGDNVLDNYGAIEGDLVAISRNIDDAFADFGDVEGRVYFAPGGQN